MIFQNDGPNSDIDLGRLAFTDTLVALNRTTADLQRAAACDDVDLAARVALPAYGFLTVDRDARAILGEAVLNRYRHLIEIGREDIAYELDQYHCVIDAF